ncbi:MAG TPA: hypothetical protein VMU30_00020 [Bacteroidota bacterium]|nr:hypothetical protein [Bacteroidota bacterium]
MNAATVPSIRSLLESDALRTILFNHFVSILFVTLVFVVLLAVGMEREKNEREQRHEVVGMMGALRNIDFNNPTQKSLFRETLDIYYQHSKARNDSVMQAIDAYRTEQYTNKVYKTGSAPRELSWQNVANLLGMYVNFIIVYLIALVVSYYATQALALYKFIQYKQQTSSYLIRALRQMRLSGETVRNGNNPFRQIERCAGFVLKACIKGGAALMLFAPAYIIVYSLKSTVASGEWLLMIVLAVASNGLLINYAQKFYALLFAESRKGYVETAVVKGWNNSYSWGTPDGIALRSLFHWKKKFPSHVLQHIYMNAHYQYIPTMKQYASFLITGLIVIEMALNIQGHLCYELLQDILYDRYEMALLIIWGIFIVVKGTELIVDAWFAYESAKYENRI